MFLQVGENAYAISGAAYVIVDLYLTRKQGTILFSSHLEDRRGSKYSCIGGKIGIDKT